MATGAVAAGTTGGEAKQAEPAAARMAAAQAEPSANAGMFARSSYGTPQVQAAVHDGPCVPPCYQYLF